VRHPHVDEDEIGLRPPYEREHLRSGLGLADDLESAVVFERSPDSVKDEPVVIGDHNAHRSAVWHRAATAQLVQSVRLEGGPLFG